MVTKKEMQHWLHTSGGSLNLRQVDAHRHPIRLEDLRGQTFNLSLKTATEVDLEVIETNPRQIQFMRNKSPRFYLEAVKRNGVCARFVPHKMNEEMLLEAIRQGVFQSKYFVQHLSEEFQQLIPLLPLSLQTIRMNHRLGKMELDESYLFFNPTI